MSPHWILVNNAETDANGFEQILKRLHRSTHMVEELLDTNQASKMLGMKSKSLANSRYTGTGIQVPFIKLGNLVRYRLSDLQSYIEDNTFNHTGEIKEALDVKAK